MTTNPVKTGVVGVGQMGRGIARNLEKKGVLGAVFDTHENAVADFAVPVLSGQAMVDAVDVILFVVPSTAQVADFLAGCKGSQTIVVDLTTSDPTQSVALGSDLGARGCHYIDAAMTGGAVGADAGSLTLMAGGEAAQIALLEPIFDPISNHVFHLGPVGSGHTMKLIHNLILHSSFMATCEGLRLADRAGLDLTAAVDVLNAGNARSFVTEVRFPRDILSGTMNGRSTVSNLTKDLGLGADMAKSLDGPAPFTELTVALLEAAREAGYADSDFTNLFPIYDHLAHSVESKA